MAAASSAPTLALAQELHRLGDLGGRVGLDLVELLVAYGAVDVLLGAGGQELAEPHGGGVGKEVGEAEQEHGQDAHLRGALCRETGKARHHREGCDDAVVAAIDDLADVVLERRDAMLVRAVPGERHGAGAGPSGIGRARPGTGHSAACTARAGSFAGP